MKDKDKIKAVIEIINNVEEHRLYFQITRGYRGQLVNIFNIHFIKYNYELDLTKEIKKLINNNEQLFKLYGIGISDTMDQITYNGKPLYPS